MDGRFSVAIEDVQKCGAVCGIASVQFSAQAEGCRPRICCAAIKEIPLPEIPSSRIRHFYSPQQRRKEERTQRRFLSFSLCSLSLWLILLSCTMSTVEKYLKPEVIRQISRLDLRSLS